MQHRPHCKTSAKSVLKPGRGEGACADVLHRYDQPFDISCRIGHGAGSAEHMAEPAQTLAALSPSTADDFVSFREEIDKTGYLFSFGQHRAIRHLKIAHDVCGKGLWHGARQSLSRISSGSTKPGHHATRASERAFVIRIVAGQRWTGPMTSLVVQPRHNRRSVGKRLVVLRRVMRRHRSFHNTACQVRSPGGPGCDDGRWYPAANRRNRNIPAGRSAPAC